MLAVVAAVVVWFAAELLVESEDFESMEMALSMIVELACPVPNMKKEPVQRQITCC